MAFLHPLSAQRCKWRRGFSLWAARMRRGLLLLPPTTASYLLNAARPALCVLAWRGGHEDGRQTKAVKRTPQERPRHDEHSFGNPLDDSMRSRSGPPGPPRRLRAAGHPFSDSSQRTVRLRPIFARLRTQRDAFVSNMSLYMRIRTTLHCMMCGIRTSRAQQPSGADFPKTDVVAALEPSCRPDRWQPSWYPHVVARSKAQKSALQTNTPPSLTPRPPDLSLHLACPKQQRRCRKDVGTEAWLLTEPPVVYLWRLLWSTPAIAGGGWRWAACAIQEGRCFQGAKSSSRATKWPKLKPNLGKLARDSPAFGRNRPKIGKSCL